MVDVPDYCVRLIERLIDVGCELKGKRAQNIAEKVKGIRIKETGVLLIEGDAHRILTDLYEIFQHELGLHIIIHLSKAPVSAIDQSMDSKDA